MHAYKFDRDTKEFLHSEDAFLDPLETEQQGRYVYLLPADSTFTAPLEPKDGYAVCWNGNSWEYIEDHRQKKDKGGVPIEGTGTPYWVPGDTWKSSARYMKEIGPLPANATTVKPEKSEKEKQLEVYRTELNDCEQYLTSTDWYVVRSMDSGVPVPDDVKAKRQKAREAIDRLRTLIAGLEEGTSVTPKEGA